MCKKFAILYILIISLSLKKSYSKKLVCVVGAGQSGLNSIKHLADYPNEFQPIAFDRRSDIGGLWNTADADVSSPIYQNLRSVEPDNIVSCPDYREFYGETGNCPPHELILDYLKNYTEHFNLRQYIEFNTVVEKVSPINVGEDRSSAKWLIELKKLKTNASKKMICDAVIVGSGINSKSKIPKIPGIERGFSGQMIHSSAYRKPEDFINQTVIILGAGVSGVEPSLDISTRAKTIYLSHRHEKLHYEMPANVIQVAGIVATNYSEFILQDGSKVSADSIIFCTGYKPDLSFLDASINIKTINEYLYPLYKSIIHIEHPSLGFVGFDPRPGTFCPPQYLQASYYVSFLRGDVKLPDYEEMIKVANSTISKKPTLEDSILIWNMWKEMAQEGHFEPIPDFYAKGYSVWMEKKELHLPYYRNYKLLVSDDGNFTVVKI